MKQAPLNGDLPRVGRNYLNNRKKHKENKRVENYLNKEKDEHKDAITDSLNLKDDNPA